VKPKPPVPAWRWGVWYAILGAALIVFYGLFTPIWFGLRTLAWIAEYRARRGGRRASEAAQNLQKTGTSRTATRP